MSSLSTKCRKTGLKPPWRCLWESSCPLAGGLQQDTLDFLQEEGPLVNRVAAHVQWIPPRPARLPHPPCRPASLPCPAWQDTGPSRRYALKRNQMQIFFTTKLRHKKEELGHLNTHMLPHMTAQPQTCKHPPQEERFIWRGGVLGWLLWWVGGSFPDKDHGVCGASAACCVARVNTRGYTSSERHVSHNASVPLIQWERRGLAAM